MLLIRPVKLDDIPALLQMSIEAGPGMTTMPNDESTWLARVKKSQATFQRQADPNKEGVYFLVAEDSHTGNVVGTTAIYVGIGTKTPFYTYKKTLLVKYSEDLCKTIETPVLNLVNDFTRAAEMGSLFLTADYRKNNYGQFMSRARYLLLSDFVERFPEDVIAEMRGWQADDGQSPFWQALGKKFFDVPFENADYISATKGSQFIQDLMPKYPVYVGLLPEEAQACIGKPHAVSAKAIHMLEKEGFRYDGYVDVFDGGPTVHCRAEHIKSVRESSCYQVRMSDRIIDKSQRYLISNRNIANYRIIVQPANLLDNVVEITPASAELLGVTEGDTVNLFAMMEKKS